MYLGNQYYIEKFRKTICPTCGLCKPDFPAFCMLVYGGNPERFINLIKYIKVLQEKGSKAILDLYTFEGFCGLFCNSNPACPNRNKKCDVLGYTYSCYEAFVDQSDIVISDQEKQDIWKSFSGIEISKIGLKHSLPKGDPLKKLPKKRRKKIAKLLKKARSEMKLGSLKTTKSKKRKPVKTTLFCNNDEEWENKINFYLEPDEADNRQPVEDA